MGFAEAQVRPGRETTLRLSVTDTSSLCAIAVVDKSIELMGATSQLTTSRVTTLFFSAISVLTLLVTKFMLTAVLM